MFVEQYLLYKSFATVTLPSSVIIKVFSFFIYCVPRSVFVVLFHWILSLSSKIMSEEREILSCVVSILECIRVIIIWSYNVYTVRCTICTILNLLCVFSLLTVLSSFNSQPFFLFRLVIPFFFSFFAFIRK